MPVFEYTGLSEAGKPVKGLKEADSPKTLRVLLRKDGIYLTEVLGQAEARQQVTRAKTSLASKEIHLGKLARGRITTDDVAITTRQLATLLGAAGGLEEGRRGPVGWREKGGPPRAFSQRQ